MSEVASAYDYTDPAHPAAVTQVADAGGTDTFTYDASGRMVLRTVDGVETTLTWDVTSSLVESGAPVEDANGVFGPPGQGGHVLYAYDAGGQRVAQVRLADADGPGSATAYVASGQVEDPDTASTSTGVVTGTRYYTFAGSTVAVRTDDGQLALMLGDEQGSTSVMMPVTVTGSGALASATLADAEALTRTSYTPYGQLRGADNLAIDRGWLGQVEDRVSADGVSGTGLTYLNARYYDPATGRFISPDPLMDPGDPRTLDPYRYADNNPVVFTDATGLQSLGQYGYAEGGTYRPTNSGKVISAGKPQSKAFTAAFAGGVVKSVWKTAAKGAYNSSPLVGGYNSSKLLVTDPKAFFGQYGQGWNTSKDVGSAWTAQFGTGVSVLKGKKSVGDYFSQMTHSSLMGHIGDAWDDKDPEAFGSTYTHGLEIIGSLAGLKALVKPGAGAGAVAGGAAEADPLIAFANSNRTSGTRFASEYTSPSGAKYYDVNAARQPLAGGHPLNATGHHGGCAEYGCLLQAFETEGPTAILGGTMRTVYVRGPNSPILLGPPNGHGAPASPCLTACQPLLDHLGVNG